MVLKKFILNATKQNKQKRRPHSNTFRTEHLTNMSITSFDHFIETLESVPSELQRNFNLMEDLDRRGGDIVKRINDCVREYRNTDNKEERMTLFKESMDLFDKARSFADDKVDLAMQTYDLVDKHIRRLESLSGAQALITPTATSTNTGEKHKNKNQSQIGANSKHSKSSSKTGKLAASLNSAGSNQNKGGAGSSGENEINSMGLLAEPLAVDMPLDPNEPKYCTCHQVSFGEMIACDNKDCPIEWFHFACVDLKSKPKGKWYCPECFNINKKGKHKTFKRQKT